LKFNQTLGFFRLLKGDLALTLVGKDVLTNVVLPWCMGRCAYVWWLFF